MSDPLRIGFVVEGKTDLTVLISAVASILDGRDFEHIQLQPQDCAIVAENDENTGQGWPGVYRWCRQVTRSVGRLGNDPLFASYDLLIVHVDADVAHATYQQGNIYDDAAVDLPCERTCPPPEATVNELRKVIIRWMGEAELPRKTVLCIPSKATEAWVYVSLFADDPGIDRIECNHDPASLFVGKPQEVRLVRRKGNRYQKRTGMYIKYATHIEEAWPVTTSLCGQALRFHREVSTVISSLGESIDQC